MVSIPQPGPPALQVVKDSQQQCFVWPGVFQCSPLSIAIFKGFLDSIISTPNPNMIKPNGFGLQCQLHRISSDILEAASMVKSVVGSKLAPC